MSGHLRAGLLTLSLATVGLGSSGCIPGAFGIEVVKPPPEAPEAPVPDKYTGEVAPTLVSSGLEGFKTAPGLDPRLYFGVEDKQWYRFAMNRWYLAFDWNGNWFPVDLDEVPAPLRVLTGSLRESYGDEVEQEKKTREEQLKDLDEKLRELENTP